MKYELTHDSIARQINAKASNDARLSKKIKAYLHNKLELYQSRNTLLNQDDLDYLRQGEDLIAWKKEEQAFIEKSKAKIARDKRRFFLIWLSIGILLLAAAIASTVFGIQANQEKEKAKLSRDSTQTALKIVEKREKELKSALDSLELKENELEQAVIDIGKERDAKEAEQKRTANALTRAEREASIANAQRLSFLANRENEKANIIDAQVLAKAAWQAAKYPKPSSTYEAFTDLWNGKKTDLLYHTPVISRQGSISRMAVSPNGDRILAVYGRDEARLYNQNGIELKRIEHENELFEMPISFSKNGQYFSTSGSDNTTNIYDYNGNLTHSFKHKNFGATFFLGQSDTILIYSADQTSSLIKIQTLKGEQIGLIENNPEIFGLVGIFPELNRIFTTDENTLFIWNMQGQLINKIAHEFVDPGILLSNDKDYFLLKDLDYYEVQGLYNIDGSLVWDCSSELIDRKISFSYLPQQIIAYNKDTISFWSNNGKKLNELILPEEISSGIFPSEINTAVFLTENKTYQIPDLVEFSKLDTVYPYVFSDWEIQAERQYRGRSFKSSDEEKFFLRTNYANDALLWSIKQNTAIKEINVGYELTDGYYAKDENLVVLEYGSRFLPLQFIPSPITSFQATDNIVNLKIAEDGKNILLEISNTAKVFNLAKRRILENGKDSDKLYPKNEWFTITNYSNFLYYIFTDFSQAPEIVKTPIHASPNKEFFWDYNQTLTHQDGRVIYTSEQKGLSLTFSPDSKYFLQGSRFGEEVIIGSTQGNIINKFKTFNSRTLNVQLSGNYKRVIITRDSILRIHEFNGKTALEIDNIGYINCLSLSKDERYLALGTKNAIAQIWDLKTNRLVQSFVAEDIIYDIKISDDNRYLLVGSGKKVMLWDTFGNLIANLDRHTGFIEKVDFFPNQKQFLSQCDNNKVIIWPMPSTIDEWFKENPIALPTEEQKRKYGLK